MTSTSFPKPCRRSRSATTGSLMHPKTQVGGAPNSRRVGRALRSHLSAASITRAPLMFVLARPDGKAPSGPIFTLRVGCFTLHCTEFYVFPHFIRVACGSHVGASQPQVTFLDNPPHFNNARMTPSPAQIGLALALVPAGRPGQSS